jgi:metallo-beta-lactamase class B
LQFRTLILTTLALGAPLIAEQTKTVVPDPPNDCSACAAWNAPQEPFKLFGNSYYVGTSGLSSVLVTSSDGLILFDGALPQSAPLIDQHIRALGFDTANIKVIANSHAHYDHAGGLNALQRATGATVVASLRGKQALELGNSTPDDPQVGFGPQAMAFPSVHNVKVVADSEVVRVGPLAITAHYTPGHTPGATTWSWQSCEGAKCVNIVYADSLSAVSAPGFKFTSDPARVEAFRKSIATVEALPCDVLIAPHPQSVNLLKKVAARKDPSDTAPFIDSASCKAFAASVRKGLETRIAEEQKK